MGPFFCLPRFVCPEPWRSGRDARPPSWLRYGAPDSKKLLPGNSGLVKLVYLSYEDFPARPGSRPGVAALLSPDRAGYGTHAGPDLRRCPSYYHAARIAAFPNQTGAIGSRALLHQLLGV